MADEYIKREDVFSLKHRLHNHSKDTIELYPVYVISPDAVEKIPSADVVEVVRCKDCRHRDPEDHKCDCGQLERAGCVFPVDDDYFCSYGERRMDGE